MADGIRIRDLDVASKVDLDDVLVIDKPATGFNTVTHQISYENFRDEVFNTDIVIKGDLDVTGDLTVNGNTVHRGDVTNMENTIVKNITINGTHNLDLDDLNDVSVPGAQANDYLIYDGSKWIASAGEDTVDFSDTHIMIEGGPEEVVFMVTVGAKSDNNQFKNVGSNNCYYLDGKESPVLILAPNRKYVFDQSDISNTGYKLEFYEEQSEGNAFTASSPGPGLTYEGVPGVAGARSIIEFTTTFTTGFGGTNIIDEQTPEKLFYRCSNPSDQNVSRAYMGGTINNIGASVKTDIGDIEGDNEGGGLFPFQLNLKEALQDLDTRLSNLESSP